MPMLPDPDQVILDTSALLAYLTDDAGAEIVELILKAAASGKVEVVIPTVAVAEAVTVALPLLGPDRLEDFRATIDQLPLTVTCLDLDAAIETAVAADVWRMGYPEAAAALAAQSPRSFVVTANPLYVWYERSGGRVYWIGPEEHRNETTLFDPLARFRPVR